MKAIKSFLFGDTRVFVKVKRWLALLIFAVFCMLFARMAIIESIIGVYFWVGIPWFLYLLIRKKL